jgi:NTP pyrophosphatase (non-canonical NTP hydrolase)
VIEKTLAQMTDEVRIVNTEKGWRDQPGKTYGDFIALLHSEVAEALEAFRKAGLADLTGKIQAAFDGVGLEGEPVKPEGVGSELADILIRLIDVCDVIGLKRDEPARGRGGRSRGRATEVDEPKLSDVRIVNQMEAMQRGQIPGPMISFGDHMDWLHSCIHKMWMDPEEADAVLSALVTVAKKYDFDLMAEYERKMAHNRVREFRHGGKLL